MTNKLGMHIHGIRAGIIEAIALLQPRTVTIMDPKPEDILAIRDVSPKTFIEMRKYEDGRSFLDTNPEWWADECYAMAIADGVVAWNEPFGHDDRALCRLFDEWSYDFLQACRQLGSMEAVVLCMATGNWTGADDRYKITDDFPLTCSSAKYFGPHEYSWPTLQTGAGWYALRFKAWIEDLKSIGRDDFYFIIGEAGLTQAVIAGRPDVGWRSGGPEGVTEDSYIATLDWYNTELCKVPECLGCCLFDWAGSHYGWPTFEQLGLEHRIYQIQAPEPPEPPEPPNGGEPVIPDRVKIYDFEHGPFADDPTASKEWLESIFGPCINVHPITEIHQPQPGEIIYQLEWINCKAGNASCVIVVKDMDGNPVEGETVIFGWPSADPHGYSNHGWNWTTNGAAGDTEADGHVGPGLSVGSYYSPDQGECGAHFIWIWDRPSEMVDGVGMLPFHDLVPGANHIHTEYGFRAVRWGEEPPTPPDPVNGDLLAVAKEIRDSMQATRADVAEIKSFLLQTPPVVDAPFKGEYFNNIDLGGEPEFIRADLVIDFEWGDGSPDPRINPDNFSVRWTGKRTFEDGAVTFHVLVDDGVRLWVDGNLLIDFWKDQPPTPHQGIITLSAGQHDIKLEYYERGGGSTIKLWWD